ncbi:MAG: hypothetical protein ACO276_00980 [Ilumatobacteraceae bacterium]
MLAMVQEAVGEKQSVGPNSRWRVMAMRVPDFTASAPAMRSCNAGRARITAWEYANKPVAIMPPTTISTITINSAEPASFVVVSLYVGRFMRVARS